MKAKVNLYGEDNRMIVIPFLRRLRVEPALGLPHKAGLQHVATVTVLTEEAIVQVHPLPRCLEV